MMLHFGRTLAATGQMFRRDREVLLGIAGPFLFLPVFALQLLVAAPPVMPGSGATEEETLAWTTAAIGWAGDNGWWYLLAYGVIYWGESTLFTLYLDPERPDVAMALRRAGRLLPRFVLAALLVALPVGLGLMLLVLPGLYAMGRLLLAAPALVARRPLGAARALGVSLAMSRGSGLALTALAALSAVARWLLATPFLLVDRMLREQGAANPVMIAIVDAGASLSVAAAELGLTLAAVVAYRRLASSGT